MFYPPFLLYYHKGEQNASSILHWRRKKTFDATSPREEKYRLDESLDEAVLTFEDTKIENPIEPLTPCDFSGHMWVVAADDAVSRFGTKGWTHTTLLVEPTKWLERFMVGTKTVTQPIIKEYVIEPKDCTAEVYDAPNWFSFYYSGDNKSDLFNALYPEGYNISVAGSNGTIIDPNNYQLVILLP